MLMKSHLDYVCRIAAGLDPKIDRTKIKVVDGKSKPRVMGQTARTVDASGNPVQHANSYRKAGGRTRNEESTRRIEVGERWLRALLEQASDAHDAWHDSKLEGPAKPAKPLRMKKVMVPPTTKGLAPSAGVSPMAYESTDEEIDAHENRND